jgi:hypothetical protein
LVGRFPDGSLLALQSARPSSAPNPLPDAPVASDAARRRWPWWAAVAAIAVCLVPLMQRDAAAPGDAGENGAIGVGATREDVHDWPIGIEWRVRAYDSAGALERSSPVVAASLVH